MNPSNTSTYAPVILRLGLTAVFAWFGVSQLVNAAMWTNLVPVWATGIFGVSAVTIVHLNGIFEVVAAVLLGVGAYVRYVAALLAVHLFVITTHLGLNAVGVRDFGLSFATLALAFFGDDRWSLTFREEKGVRHPFSNTSSSPSSRQP